MRTKLIRFSAAVFFTMLAISVIAKADPPSRVARISYLHGEVSLNRGDLDDWDSAVINYPVTVNDSVWADSNSRAELHIGSIAIRLSSDTDISFLNLNDNTVQIRIAEGATELHVRQLGTDEVVELDTPNGSASLLRAGDYRVDVNDEGDTTITVRHGQAEFTGNDLALPITAGQSVYIPSATPREYQVSAAAPPDDFDRWANERTRREEQALSARYVSRELIGYEDLDAYGTWRVVPGYGTVWTPLAVAADWAPYRLGHWIWVEPWGWTWVDVEPWGFAPFHYGRWAYVERTWYWVPGPVAVRPVYAPALVGFIGGSHWNLSVNFGGGSGIGWFPLGPGEPYRPAYRVSPTYLRTVNVTNVNVTNINVTNYNTTYKYVNQQVPGAVTAVPQTAFASGRPVASARVNVPPQAVAQATVIGSAPPVVPQRASLAVQANKSANAPQPPAKVLNRVVMTRTQPAPTPVPFAVKQSALVANPGHPLEQPALEQLRRSAPVKQSLIVKPIAGNNAPVGQPGKEIRRSPATTGNKVSVGQPAGNQPKLKEAAVNPPPKPATVVKQTDSSPPKPATAPTTIKPAPPTPANVVSSPEGKPPVPGAKPAKRLQGQPNKEKGQSRVNNKGEKKVKKEAGQGKGEEPGDKKEPVKKEPPPKE